MKVCAVCGKLKPSGRMLQVRGLPTLPPWAYVCAGPCWRSAVDAIRQSPKDKP